MRSILVVESDALFGDIIAMMLEILGHRPVLTWDRASSCATLDRGNIDAVISKIVLPDGTGFEVCDYARSKGVPGCLLTGHVLPKFQIGLRGRMVLRTPFGTAELGSVIRSMVASGA